MASRISIDNDILQMRLDHLATRIYSENREAAILEYLPRPKTILTLGLNPFRVLAGETGTDGSFRLAMRKFSINVETFPQISVQRDCEVLFKALLKGEHHS